MRLYFTPMKNSTPQQDMRERFEKEFYSKDNKTCVWHRNEELLSFITSEINRAVAEEYQRIIDLLTRDHKTCPLPQTCIGYQNALSDIENNPPNKNL